MLWKEKRPLLISLSYLILCIKLSTQQGLNFNGATKSAATRTFAVTPEASRIIAEMRAFSEYLAPAFTLYEASPVYSGCQDAYNKGARQAGVYPITKSGSSFRAWCDFDSSGGWMVLQRRVDGEVEFYRRFDDYKLGFGNLWGEYWLGLDKTNLMTLTPVALSIYMEAFDGTFAWANYSTFSVGNAASEHTLTVSGFSGTFSDNLEEHNGKKFSTWDRDNDLSSVNCAGMFLGAWWYGDCHSSNLNGRYEKGPSSSYATSNCWYSYKGFYYGLKTSIMRFRA